jgi:hypothetical protein
VQALSKEGVAMNSLSWPKVSLLTLGLIWVLNNVISLYGPLVQEQQIFSNLSEVKYVSAKTPVKTFLQRPAIDFEMGAPVSETKISIPSENIQMQKYAAGCLSEVIGNEIGNGLIELRISAPCHQNEVVSIFHAALSFDQKLDDKGQTSVVFPALTQKAVTMVSISNEKPLVHVQNMAVLKLDERLVLQWQGKESLYLVENKKFSNVRLDVQDDLGKKRLMPLILGDGDHETARKAIVYSRALTSLNTGADLGVSVYAKQTKSLCGHVIAFDTITISAKWMAKARDFRVTASACAAQHSDILLKIL